MSINRKLGVKSAHRKAMLRNLATVLFENGKMMTTLCRAKELRKVAEKLITSGKVNDLNVKRKCISSLASESIAYKLINEISPKYKERQGGYTRIVRLGVRKGDCAEMAVIELV